MFSRIWFPYTAEYSYHDKFVMIYTRIFYMCIMAKLSATGFADLFTQVPGLR